MQQVRHAGHSKWAKIARSKGAADVARGQLFSKLGRSIQAAVRAGGSDQSSNLMLAAALDQAKKNNMPKDNVERALKGKEGAVMQSFTFEAVGPAGTAFFVDCLSDSKTRATSNVRSYFAKAGGELQATGAVAWMFTERGKVEVSLPASVSVGSSEEEAFEGRLIDAAAGVEGVEDVAMPAPAEEGGEDDPGTALATVWTSKESVQSARAGLTRAGFTCITALVERVPNTRVPIPPAQEDAFSHLLAKLDGDDDVQGYVHNAEE